MNVRDLLKQASAQICSDSSKLDAQLLLAEVLGKDRTWLFTWDDAKVSLQNQTRFQELVSRRVKGEPIAHILARREFWGLDMECDSSTLIPRPETELLVEQALQLAIPENARVLDLGTGAGGIALALASEKPGWQIQAVDFSEQAVTLARRNKDRHPLANVNVFQSNWFDEIGAEKQFHLIVSNPPYVDSQSPYLDEGDIRFEPKSALISDHAGMADIERIVSQASSYLVVDGWLLIEHGFDQQDRVQNCFEKKGFKQVQTLKDLASLPRVTLGVCRA